MNSSRLPYSTEPTPLIKLPSVAGYDNVYVKDESIHRGGTFKDRLARAAIARYAPGTTFGAISYGNTAFSFAQLIAELRTEGIDYHFVAFVPSHLRKWRFGPSTSGTTLSGDAIINLLSRHVHIIRLDLSARIYDDRDLEETARAAGVPCDNFVNVTEGIDIPAYVDIAKEAVSQMGHPPDICIVQYGAGILSNEVMDYLHEVGDSIVVPISVPNPNSLARMLYGPIWLDTYTLRKHGVARSRHKSPDRTGRTRKSYPVFRTMEKQISTGLELARRFNLRCEPSGAAGLGFLPMIGRFLHDKSLESPSVLLINTGSGIDAMMGVLE